MSRARRRADDVELAVAREQRAGQHAGDNAEVVDAPRHRQHRAYQRTGFAATFPSCTSHQRTQNKAGARQRVRPRRARPPRTLPRPPRPEPFAGPVPLRRRALRQPSPRSSTRPRFRLLSAKSERAQSGTPASLVSAYLTIFIARTPEVAARPAAANPMGRHAAAVKRRNPLPACSAAKQARIQKRSSDVRSSDRIIPYRAESPSPRQQQPNAFRQSKSKRRLLPRALHANLAGKHAESAAPRTHSAA